VGCPDCDRRQSDSPAAVVAGLEKFRRRSSSRPQADNIFLEGDAVIFIDLDSPPWAIPSESRSSFCPPHARVGMELLPERRPIVAAAAFVEEYFNHAPRRGGGSSLCIARRAYRSRGAFFKRQEPRWPEKVRRA